MMRVVVVALVLAAVRPARAEDCSPEGARVRATQLLGRDPVATHAIAIDVHGRNATITIDDAGSREVTARDCDELVESIALVIVMSVRASPQGKYTARQATDAEPPPPITVALPMHDPVDAASRAAGNAARFESAVLIGGGLGVSSLELDQRLSLGARLRRDDYSLDVLASVHGRDAIGVGNGHIEVGLTSFTFAPCAHPTDLTFCAAASAGWFSGRGDRLVDSRTAQLVYAALGARVGREWKLTPRLGVALTLDADVPLLTSRFLVDQMAVWTNRWLEVSTGATAIVQIP
jgi:hypothetical protein